MGCEEKGEFPNSFLGHRLTRSHIVWMKGLLETHVFPNNLYVYQLERFLAPVDATGHDLNQEHWIFYWRIELVLQVAHRATNLVTSPLRLTLLA